MLFWRVLSAGLFAKTESSFEYLGERRSAIALLDDADAVGPDLGRLEDIDELLIFSESDFRLFDGHSQDQFDFIRNIGIPVAYSWNLAYSLSA